MLAETKRPRVIGGDNKRSQGRRNRDRAPRTSVSQPPGDVQSVVALAHIFSSRDTASAGPSLLLQDPLPWLCGDCKFRNLGCLFSCTAKLPFSV